MKLKFISLVTAISFTTTPTMAKVSIEEPNSLLLPQNSPSEERLQPLKGNSKQLSQLSDIREDHLEEIRDAREDRFDDEDNGRDIREDHLEEIRDAREDRFSPGDPTPPFPFPERS